MEDLTCFGALSGATQFFDCGAKILIDDLVGLF